MNEVQKNIGALQAAIDLVGRYPKHSDIKNLPNPRHQNENNIPVAAAAVAVSALQDPVLDYASKFNTIYNKIIIILPSVDYQKVAAAAVATAVITATHTNEQREQENNVKPQVAAAAVATATVPSSKPSSSPSDYDTIFNIIYNGINIKLLPNTANDRKSNEESSVTNEPIQKKFNTIFDGLKIILPKEERKDPTNFVAAAAVAVAAQSKSSSVDREMMNRNIQTDPNTHEILRKLSLHDQLYLFTKLLANCIYISDYNIKTLLNDIITESSQSRYNNEIFSYDKSKHELADKIGDHIINFFK